MLNSKKTVALEKTQIFNSVVYAVYLNTSVHCIMRAIFSKLNNEDEIIIAYIHSGFPIMASKMINIDLHYM